MKINKGDRIKFLNDTGTGVVIGIKDKKTAMVLRDDGFEVPVPLGELIRVEDPENYQNTAPGRSGSRSSDERPGLWESYHEDIDPDDISLENEPEIVPDEQMPVNPSLTEDVEETWEPEDQDERVPERNILLGFVESGDPEKLDAWLINDSSFHVLYILLLKEDNTYSTLKGGMIEADTKIFVKSFSREQLNQFISLQLQAMYFRKGIFNPITPTIKEVAIDPVKLYGPGSMGESDFFEKRARIITLVSDARDRERRKISEQEVRRILEEKDDKIEIKSKSADDSVEEVDLHIEELVDDPAGMPPKEILDIQMARFITALEGSIRSGTRRIVFIHGVGNGKLKFEIRKTLDQKYPRLKYQDASFEEYGYGATMVIIKK